MVQQWQYSPHAAAKEGQVGCMNCHAADKGDELKIYLTDTNEVVAFYTF